MTAYFWLQDCILSSEDMRESLTGGHVWKCKRTRGAHLSICLLTWVRGQKSQQRRLVSLLKVMPRKNCSSVSTAQKWNGHLVSFVKKSVFLMLLRLLLISDLHVLRASEGVFFFLIAYLRQTVLASKTNKQTKKSRILTFGGSFEYAFSLAQTSF